VLTAPFRGLVITCVLLGSAAAALAVPPTADAAGTACAGAAATVLTLPSGATGGSVTVRTPSGFAGSVRRADGSDVPAVWTAGPSGGYSVTALSLADGQTDGYVTGANSAGTLVVTESSSADEARTWVIPDSPVSLENSASWAALDGPAASADVWGQLIDDGGAVTGAYADAGTWINATWTPQSAGASGYRITRLSPLPGDSANIIEGTSPGGDVVGASSTATDSTVVVWPQSGRPLAGPALSSAADLYTTAAAVNDHGLLGGTAFTAGGHDDAWVASPGGAVHDLGVMPGDDYAIVWGVSDGGVAVGDSLAGSGAARGLYWAGTGAVRELPGPAGLSAVQRTAVFGIGDDDIAWGESGAGLSGPEQPVVWTCASRLAHAPATPAAVPPAPAGRPSAAVSLPAPISPPAAAASRVPGPQPRPEPAARPRLAAAYPSPASPAEPGSASRAGPWLLTGPWLLAGAAFLVVALTIALLRRRRPA
jgi:hypothetical protein